MSQWIITAVGSDRPGLVGELTGLLHEGGANLLDSRMINLRGQFAIVLLMEAEEAAGARLAEQLPGKAEQMGLRLDVAPQIGKAQPVAGLPFRLRTYASDQPGIVSRITGVLRDHGINIEELETTQQAAAFAGTPLFIMDLRLVVPNSVPVRTLRKELETLCDELNCDVDLEPDER